MALPFQNPVSQCMPGFGAPSYEGSATQTVTTNATTTIVIAATSTTPSTAGTPFNPNGGPAPTSGKWHLRIVNATTTAIVTIQVQVTDGTNIWTVYLPGSAFTLANGYLDLTGEFKTDVSITAVNFVVITTGTSTSVPIDCEVSLT